MTNSVNMLRLMSTIIIPLMHDMDLHRTLPSFDSGILLCNGTVSNVQASDQAYIDFSGDLHIKTTPSMK